MVSGGEMGTLWSAGMQWLRVVTGDVNMLSIPGRGTVRVQSGSPGTQTLFLFMPDIICESCDGEMEMESGGEVGTLVSGFGSPGTRLMTVNTCQHTWTLARPHTYTVPVRVPGK